MCESEVVSQIRMMTQEFLKLLQFTVAQTVINMGQTEHTMLKLLVMDGALLADTHKHYLWRLEKYSFA